MTMGAAMENRHKTSEWNNHIEKDSWGKGEFEENTQNKGGGDEKESWLI